MGELSSDGPTEPNRLRQVDKPLDQLRDAWLNHKTLWHALDFMAGAFVLERHADEDVRSAATFVLTNPTHCPEAALALAERILRPDSEPKVGEPQNLSPAQLYQSIHERRRRIREDPRNVVALVDLARLYTILGQHDRAGSAIELACAQAGDNRFVLRSAARFFVHIGEGVRALKLLRRYEGAASDPWLVAAELGVAVFSGASPSLVKPAKRLLESEKFPPFMLTELASALATLELQDGRTGPAKRLFRRSLAAPTENSLAQAEWASKQIAGLHVDVASSNTPRTYEATALYAFTEGDWQTVLDSSLSWLNDQPFSSRPAGLASYIYSEMFGQHDRAEAILRRGLVANPNDRLLTNNLAFALISQGKIEEAEELIGGVDINAENDLAGISLAATRGMLFLRKGRHQEGLNGYRQAIAAARRSGQRRLEILAELNLAREAVIANLPSKREILREAGDAAKKQNDLDVAFIFAKVLQLTHSEGP